MIAVSIYVKNIQIYEKFWNNDLAAQQLLEMTVWNMWRMLRNASNDCSTFHTMKS